MNDFYQAVLMAVEALNEVYGEDVTFTSQTEGEVTFCRAVRMQATTDNQFGVKGASRRRLTFNLSIADVPLRPGKNDVITAHDGEWFVKEVPDLALDGMWRVGVEQSGRRT